METRRLSMGENYTILNLRKVGKSIRATVQAWGIANTERNKPFMY